MAKFYRSIPFYIVLFASVLPWAAAAADSKMLTYIPDVLAALAYALLVAQYPERGFKIHRYFAVVLLLVGGHVIFGGLSGRGIGSAGLVSLFALTFVFSKLLDQGNTAQLARDVVRQIGLVYIIHVVFILAELLFRLAGHTEVLVAIAGHATVVTKYKMYNSATFLNYLGVEDISGMNSLLLGSQSASQLVLLAAFCFAPLYRGGVLIRNGLSYWIWFVLAVLLFPFVASMTAMAILAVLVFFLIYVLPNSILHRRIIWIMTPLLLIAFGGVLLPIFAFRITQAAHVDIYMNAFMDAPIKFLDLPLLDQIMGFGRHIHESPIAAADFGLGMITYQAGLSLVGLALICLLGMIYVICVAIRRCNRNGIIKSPWPVIAGINIVCAIGWTVSLIHYTPAIELGGRHLFAMHLAVCLVALKRMADIRYSASVGN